MAFKSFRNLDIPQPSETGPEPTQAPQPTSPIDHFTMTSDQITKKVHETHVPGNENYDAESLFNVLLNIIKQSDQIIGIDPPKGTKQIELAKDKLLLDNFTLPCSQIKQIGHQMICHPAHDLNHAHQTTMIILHGLERYNWGAKATITLAAFAVEYGNLLHRAEIQATTGAPIGKLLVQLQNHWLHGIETKREAFAELNNLVKTVLQVTHSIMELESLSNRGYDKERVPKLFEAIKEIPVDVYWIIITTAVCFAYIGYLKGDSEDKLELSLFDQKLSSILTSLTTNVTQIRKEIDAVQDHSRHNTDLISTEINQVNPISSLRWKNTFSYGTRGMYQDD
ncbi:hypothetical protein L6164_025775 [Bauhinia variegata]|uniref:Uncharacterized protein n=1 Tax=Bauhinia variegata TaxID=167791 RepID=A0ACB9M2L6_BAUVA|nr:hypothetical protein L6164_025775 [Bauhinia variegata]